MGNFKLRIQNLFGGDDIVEDPKAKSSSGGKSTILSCAKCSLHGKKQVIDPINKTAIVLIVGEAPGREEEKEGSRFVGRSGRLFRDCLEQAGFRVARDVQFDNVCRCRPSDDTDGNRAPSTKEVAICKELYLDKELERHQHIIVAGKIPQIAVLGKTKGNLRGNVVSFKGKRIAVTYHPSAILRRKNFEPGLEQRFTEDLRFFHSVFVGGYEPKYTLVVSEKTRNDCLADILNSREITFDVETTGLELDSVLNVVGVGTEQNAYSIPVVGKYAANQELVKRIFQFKDKLYIGFNVQFDYNLLLANGLCARNLRLADAMIMEHMLNSSRGRETYGLKSLAVEKGFRWSRLVINPANPEKFEDLFPYSAEDVINTRALYHANRTACKEKKLISLSDKVVFPAINVISEMEYTGIGIDLTEMKRVRTRLISQIDILETELSEKFGERNWGSTAQIQDLLGKWLAGNAVKTVTKTGAIGTNEPALKLYQEYAETTNIEDFKLFCSNMLKLRELKKLLSTYVEGLSAKVQGDGKLHGHFSLIGTATGRLSSSGPNLQNIPRDARIKSMFVVPKGWSFLEADASQIELRVVASIAPEPIMIKAYNAGEDLHSLTASIILRVPIDKVTKHQRQTAKAVNFGFIYGQSWQGFKVYAKSKFGVVLTDDEAKTFRQNFFDKYFGIQHWHKRVEMEIMRGQQTVTTVFGRLRYLDGDNTGHLTRQALNTPVQSPASDCNLIAMRYVWDNVDYNSAKFVLTVHDQFMLMVKDEYLDTAVKVVSKAGKHVDDSCPWLKVHFVLDMKVGKNWGNTKELK